jgi:YHS domain-containing protein
MNRMTSVKTITLAAMFLAMLSTGIQAADLVNVSGASRIALQGFDAVGFFTDSKAENGSPFIRASYQGAEYLFATEDHKRLFLADPGKYVPQYGGFCAFGVGVNALFPVDITTWQIRNGKLYLNLDHDILDKFNADFEGHVASADRNWPGLVKKNGQ